MASLVSDRGGAEAAGAHAAAPNLLLAVRRVAELLTVRQVAAVGPLRLDLGGDPAVVTSEQVDDTIAQASHDGVVVVSDRVPWEGLNARAIIAVDLDPHGSALDALAKLETSARAAGRHVAYSGLLHTAGTGKLSVRRECPLVVACRPDDGQLVRAMATGPLSLALDPAMRAGAATRAARVLIASYEVTGPTGNGGIGTAYHSLAHALATAGHDVTVLFTGWVDPARRDEAPAWREAFAASGIAFELLGTPWDVPVRSPHYAVRRAYELHRWLAEAHARRPFDVVHLPECQGHGAFAQTAKALGLAYANVEFVVGTHSSTRWIAEANREALESLDQLVTEQLERLSVERADVLLSPSAYLVDYMRTRGWRLPQRTFVTQYARPQSVRTLAAESASAAPAARQLPSELVFFGRLETRKGLEAFCDAVDVLVADANCPFEQITLLGRPERVMGEQAAAFVARRAAAWDLPCSILPDLGHADAVAYLRSHACVVAIPSLVDNSPNTVSEAVALGVPFVASRSGGTGELVAPDDLATATFDGWGASATLEPPAFEDAEVPFDARALAAALRAKAAAPDGHVAPAVDATAVDRVYDDWHRSSAGTPPVAPMQPSRLPQAAVLIAEADAADIPRIAAALGDGTRLPAHLTALCDDESDAATEVAGADLTLVPAAGRDQGRARNEIAAALEADILIVLRGNEEPDAQLVEQVCSAMALGDADVLSLVSRDPQGTRGEQLPDELRRAEVPDDLRAFVPIPGPAAAALAYPALSVGPYAIRREALEQLDGYADDLWGEALDHELLARAALAGMRIDVLPDPVATTLRDDRWSEPRARFWGDAPFPAADGEEQIRLLRPFRRLLPPELADLPALLVGALRTGGEAFKTRREIFDVYEARVTEQRELIELYEQRQEELRAAIARHEVAPAQAAAPPPDPATHRRLQAWPGRAVRFARWHLTLLLRKLR